MSEPPHGRLIAVAARQQLAPLGLVRKGRSRLWLGDRSWYLVVVEFQPSSYSNGSYLNAGACFLWYPGEHPSFDLGDRVEDFHPYESERQFEAVATSLAARAAAEVKSLDSRLTSFGSAAGSLLPESLWWRSYHRAVALALAGEPDAAQKLFRSIRSAVQHDSPSWVRDLSEQCAELEQLLPRADGFRAKIAELINARRQQLKLEPRSDPLRAAA